MTKKRLIVFASTFPRWEDDTNPPFVYELSKRLTNDFEVHVLTPAYPGAKKYEIIDNMKVHRFHYFIPKYEKLAGSGGILPTLKKNKLFYFQVPFFMIAEFFALKKLVQKIKPHVVHSHWIIPQGFATALVHKFTGVPYVVTSHGGDIFGLQGKINNLMKKYTLNSAKHITVVSSAIKKEIEKKINPDLNVKIVPMGVDSRLFNQNKRDLSIKKEYSIEGPFLLFVGRLSEKKGVRYLIEAMPSVVKKYPQAKLMIIGGGELETELKSVSRNLNMEDNIVFTGPIQNKELPKYYATADIFIAPSIVAKDGDTEGLGLTLVEAGMSGCWLIGTNVGGIKEVIENSKSGYIIEEKSSEEISKSILKSISQKNSSKNWKKLTKFDLNDIAEEYSNLLI